MLKAVGVPGYLVTPVARPDRRHRVYFQWPRAKVSATGHRGGHTKIASDIVWPADTEAQAALLSDVLARARAISQARRDGVDLSTLKRLASPTVTPTPEPAPAKPTPDAITLRYVMERAIGPSPRDIPPRAHGLRAKFYAETPPTPKGLYKKWSAQARMSRGLADKIEDKLGGDTPFFDLTPNDARELWKEGVADNAIKKISVLLRVSRWAEVEYAKLGYRRLVPPSATWQQDVRAATRPEGEERASEIRYTTAEAGRVWQVLQDPESKISPVVRLAALVNAEARLGQVLNLKVQHCRTIWGAWYMKPPEYGRKITAWSVVPFAYQVRFQEAVTAARGRPDQRIFPIQRRNALTAWHKIERLARVKQYGWYAMRRTMIDLCIGALKHLRKDPESPLDVDDDVVLDLISGHKPTGIRKALYLDAPIGDRGLPVPGSMGHKIIMSARTVVDHARATAVENFDNPYV